MYEQQFTYTSATNCPTPIYPEKCTLTAKNSKIKLQIQIPRVIRTNLW